MPKRIGGSRRKSRYKFKKYFRAKGKIRTTDFLQQLKSGDKVCLYVEPAVQKGMYHARFMGKIGTVKAKRGKCYEVDITDGNKEKTLIVHPVHLKRV